MRKSLIYYTSAFAFVSSIIILGCIAFFAKEDAASLVLEKRRVFIAVPPFDLVGGLPIGGSYSGPGVSNNRFSPEIAGVGIHEIVYTYCGKSAVDCIEVFGARKRYVDPACVYCKGSGYVDCEPRVRCDVCSNGRIVKGSCVACSGTGRVRTAWKLWLGTRNCADCYGSGLCYERCVRCKGTGLVKCSACKGTGKSACKCVK